MRCKRCGRENQSNARRCIYCNTPFYGAYSNINMPQGRNVHNTRSRKKANDRKVDNAIFISIIALTLALAILVGVCVAPSFMPRKKGFGSGGGGGGASIVSYTPDFDNNNVQVILDRIKEINGGIMPEIMYDIEAIPSFIDGKYSNLRVTDIRTAILSLQDIKALMRFENPMNEYVGIETYSEDSHKFYKLQQVVSGVDVYGKQLIVETDLTGNIECLSCDYDAGLSAVSTTPTFSEADAKTKALEYSEQEKTYNSELCVYSLGETPCLTWKIDVGSENMKTHRMFISAEDGSLVSGVSLLLAASVEATATDLNNESRTIKVSQANGSYTMKDEEYGITVYDCNNTSQKTLITSSDNTWNNPAAVSAFADLREIMTYYLNSIHTRAFENGKLKEVNIWVNYKRDECEDEKENNAYFYPDDENLKTVSIRYGSARNFAACFDVTAHEFTHAVVAATCKLEYLNESGAINEAYADIIGNLVQNSYNDTTEWNVGENLDGGSSRSLSNPNKYRQPEKVGGKYAREYCHEKHNHGNAGCDNGGVHFNSGIVNKAAYLMYKNGLNDKLELATLFSRSMNYMVSTSDFLSCRAAVIRAARDMGMGSDKISIIMNAFDSVGIKNQPTNWIGLNKGTLSGQVADATTNNPLPDVEIIALRVLPNDRGASISYSNANGLFSTELPEGTYELTVGASGYLNCTIKNVKVEAGETTYLENTILLTEIAGAPLSQASGVVTNAVSGEAVEGVQLKFRKEWGMKDGEYVKNERGTDIVITTDAEGKYYTADLPYGYYTAEVSKEGYVTQYKNIVASNQESVSMSQNVVLSPVASGNDFRITLEWDENPRDEDAHIVGDLPVDFHVYFGRKTASANGEVVATLDHDDTLGNGFETVTLKASDSGTYKYYVHHYAGNGNLATSNAKVKVYQGGVLIKEYNVPVDQGNGRYWNVFNIVNGEVVPINRISDSAEQ